LKIVVLIFHVQTVGNGLPLLGCLPSDKCEASNLHLDASQLPQLSYYDDLLEHMSILSFHSPISISLGYDKDKIIDYCDLV